MTLRLDNSDANVFRQVFRYREYDLTGTGQWPRIRTAYEAMLAAGQRPIIIDAGANVGASTLFFATTYPEATVLAVEPDVENIEMCRLNTRGCPNVRVIRAGLGGEIGRVELLGGENGSWSITTERSTEGSTELVTVPQLLEQEGEGSALFMVKIDIEGFESDVFETAEKWIDQPAVLFIEIHDWMLPGRYTSVAVQRAVAPQGFEMLTIGENTAYIR
ncbi:MAG TPA: FkbM family methyltransferase [Ilumatobacteraceae bacterium]|nr:FkbM family methyltransferase [Ilumatobacteraceae bacterium]